MSKNKIPVSAIVYSTDPQFNPEYEKEESPTTLEPGRQILKLRLETKSRAGKAVTLLEGFSGTAADKETIGRQLKTYCGTGGSVKDGEILVQGDHREKMMQWLLKNGYKNVRKL